jgi:DNA-binding response OmpR family regulator
VEEQGSGPILVVDDDAAFRELITTVVRGAGYRAVEAATGEEALEAAYAEDPQVVVLDIRLPGLSGHEVCSQIRRLPGGGPPVLFVSGERTASFDRVGGLLVGGDDYLVKPFAPDELLARIRSLVRRFQERAPRSPLTEREIAILRLLAEGLEQGEVAQRLEVSPKAVRGALKSVVSKLTA